MKFLFIFLSVLMFTTNCYAQDDSTVVQKVILYSLWCGICLMYCIIKLDTNNPNETPDEIKREVKPKKTRRYKELIKKIKSFFKSLTLDKLIKIALLIFIVLCIGNKIYSIHNRSIKERDTELVNSICYNRDVPYKVKITDSIRYKVFKQCKYKI